MKPSILRGFKAKGLALSVSAIASTFALSPALYAQERLEEIQVTGTRIRATDGMVTPTPVTAVTVDELSSFNPGASVSDQLDMLPQFFGNGSAEGGGAALFGDGGGSYLDMRNLGTNRTLVLVDGRRLPPGDKRGTVNTDTIPSALVRTLDIQTGGASAQYGADALAGVTNYILDREFEGLKIQAGTGINEYGDGFRYNGSIAGGVQIGDKLHLIGSLELRRINQVTRLASENDSDWYQRWGYVTNPAWISASATPNVPQRLSLPNVCSSEHSPTGVIWARTGANSNSPLNPFAMNGMTFTEDGQNVRPFVHGDVYADPARSGSTKSMSGGPECAYAFDAFGGGAGGDRSINRAGFFGAKYDLTDNLSLIGEIMIGRSESGGVAERGGGSLQDGWYATIYRENAFLPDSVAQAMDEAGISSFQLHKLGSFVGANEPGIGSDDKAVFTTTSYRAGFEYLFNNEWDWSLTGSYQVGKAHKRAGLEEIRVDRIFLAMDAVRDPATGAIVCNVQLYNPTPEQLQASVAGRPESPGGAPGGTRPPLSTNPLLSPVGLDNTIRDCIPWNVMGQGNATPQVLDYLSTYKYGDGVVDQDFAELLWTGGLFGLNLPGADDINFAAGLTYRDQSFNEVAGPREVDVLGPPLNAPDLGIRGIPAGYTGGSANLHQFSTFPDVGGQYDVWEWFGEVNVPLWARDDGPQRIDGGAAFRASNYSSIGRIESWKVQLQVQLLEDLRFRTTKSQDVREATFAERFDFQGGGGTVTDPRFNNTSFQITTVSGGDVNLRPEIGDTIVMGFTYEPRWLDGLSLSTDYWDIEIKDAISTLGAQRIVDECEINGVADLCTRFDRDPATGFIGRVFNTFLNVAQAKAEGVDFEGRYRFEPNLFADQDENVSIRVLAGYLMERSNTPLGGTPTDSVGTTGSPEITATASLNYNIGPYGIGWTQRYVADTRSGTSTWVVGTDIDRVYVPSANLTNLQLSYRGDLESGGDWRVSFNVTNLFDRMPPPVASYGTRGGSQTVPGHFDDIGRRYQISLNMNF
ncbi:MAG: TonB-dependent receptor [Pseudomonadales bacterium]|jgi:outer membrane receptor protein involved in Fe transport|nr:TonB-dependent receptor [Pseudomonadales bacterium]